MNFKFLIESNVIVGNGTVRNLHKIIKELGYTKPLFIVDEGFLKSSLWKKIYKKINSNFNKIKIVVTSGKSEPTYNALRKNLFESKKTKCDLIVGIGGGSCLDTAKAIAALIKNKGDPIIYKGVSAITVLGTRETPDVKTTNYKVCYDAWKLAKKQKFFEAILIDNDGSVLEGSRSNIFWVKDGQLFTREGGVLPGVTRQTIIQYSPYPVIFESLNQNEIDSLDELFLTNSGSGIIPIIQVDKQVINDSLIGKMTHQLLRLYKDWMYKELIE